ncbi:MAG: hypothetical protein ABIK43_00270, partial [candidate division WOR-3 bacterium]
MKRLLTVSLMLILGWAVFSCSRQAEDPEAEIRTLLASSGYTNDSHASAYGSADSTLAGGGEGDFLIDGELPPFVRFIRYIPGGSVSRNVDVQIPAYPGYPDTTALATITIDVLGELRTAFDTTTHPIKVWRKPFHDRAVRRVYLTKNETGWHIRKVTPLNITTVNAPYSLRLVSLHAEAASGEVFDLTNPDTLLAKEELPTFVPGDTVFLQVTLASDGDLRLCGFPRPQSHHAILGRADAGIEAVGVDVILGHQQRPIAGDAFDGEVGGEHTGGEGVAVADMPAPMRQDASLGLGLICLDAARPSASDLERRAATAALVAQLRLTDLALFT